MLFLTLQTSRFVHDDVQYIMHGRANNLLVFN